MTNALSLCTILVDRIDHGWNPFIGAFAILWLCVAIAAILFSIYCWWRVAQKCGYPGAYSLLLLIPLVNIVIQLVWIFSEWPIEAELKRLRAGAPPT